jgi:hypothetical protein
MNCNALKWLVCLLVRDHEVGGSSICNYVYPHSWAYTNQLISYQLGYLNER